MVQSAFFHSFLRMKSILHAQLREEKMVWNGAQRPVIMIKTNNMDFVQVQVRPNVDSQNLPTLSALIFAEQLNKN